MKRRTLLAALATSAATPAFAQTAAWPTRPLRCIVGAGPGGTTDILARLVAPSLGALLGQPVVVENRLGAGSSIAAEATARARPDGYTMMLLNNAHAAAAAIFKRLPFDPVEDFAPATFVATMPLVFLVSKDSPLTTLDALVRDAKARPGALNYASVGVGSTQHFVAEALQAATGITLTHVPYRNTPDLLIGLRNNEVQIVVETLGAVIGPIRDGESRALGLSTAQRFAGMPDIPTVEEAAGLRGFDLPTWYALTFPARTPAPIVDGLQAAVAKTLEDADIRRQFQGLGLTPVSSTPEATRTRIVAEIARARDIVARAGIPQQ